MKIDIDNNNISSVMSSSNMPMNIQRNIDLMFPSRSKTWRQNHMVDHIATVCPTVTILSMRDKYRQAHGKQKDTIIHEMVSVFLAEARYGPILTYNEIEETTRLSTFVFKYYRHKFNEAINADNTILLHESFELLKLVEENPDEIHNKRWISLIVASTQSGKTFLMIALSHIFTALGYDTIFFVKDMSQTTQFFGRKIKDSSDLQEALKKAGFSQNNIDLFDQPLYHDSSMSSSHGDQFLQGVEATLNRTKRRSIVCIHNAVQLTRIYNQITPNSRFILIVDEAHKLGAYKKMTEDTEKTYKDGVAEDSYDQMFINIKVFAQKIFLVTATPQAILISEPALYSDGIVIVPEGKDYRGIESWKFELLPSTKDENYLEINGINRTGKEITTKVPASFFEKMAQLSDMEPIQRINRFGINDYLPIGLIAKFEVSNDAQSILLQSMKSDYNAVNEDHQKIIDSKWCSIVFNMYGIRLYDNSLRGATVSIKIFEGTSKKKTFTYTDNNESGEFLFPREHIQIEDVLHWLWLNGGHTRFPHIVVFTYKSAEEGITFSSKWGETPETCANWHFLYMYSRMGDSVSAANKEQASGRMNGNHGDFDLNGKPLLCTHWDTLVGKEKLIKGVNLHRKMIKDLCQLKFNSNDGRVIDYIKKYEMYSNRIPLNYYGDITGAQSTIKKIHNPHADIENQSFTHSKDVLITLQMINPEEYGDKRRNKTINEYFEKLAREKEIDEQMGINSPTEAEINAYGREDYNEIVEKFKKWSSASSIVSDFIKNIEYTKIYTQKQFRTLCQETGVEPTHTQRRKYGSSSGYGRIIEKMDGNKYRLYPVLVYSLRRALEYVG